MPPSADWQQLSDAAAYAFAIHGAQVRKGANTPYIGHLMSVAGLVLEHGGDQEQAVAGLLHDAIEDCGVEQEDLIRERFGERVARIVRACTDADIRPKPPWRARKEQYLRHLETEEPETLLISCCDKLHNARAIVSDLRTHGEAVFERFNAPKEGTLWYYDALAAVFSRRLPGAASRDLAAEVAEMQALARGNP
jgi:(p)ppGpp synthase/HD superfamily hydrolase